MAVSGCNGENSSEGSPDAAGPDGTPLDRATRTGELIGNTVFDVVVQIDIEGRAREEVWHEAYGPFVSAVPSAGDGILFDQAFELGPRQERWPEYSMALDGLPIVELPYSVGRGGFFYELTVLDPRTGAIYQGDNYDGINVTIDMWGFRGPLTPPENARVTRSDVQSVDRIDRVIADAARATIAARCAETAFEDECVLW
jgi:hypothetical protein